MRFVLLYVFVTLLAAAGLSGCGTKGSLKTPTQAEQEKAKKAKKEADKKKAEEEKAAKEKEQQPVTEEAK